MRNVEVRLDRDSVIGETDPRLFGALIEHLGRCVYGGIHEPATQRRTARLRKDVLALVRELAPTIMRYRAAISSRVQLGDGVGPVKDRPASSTSRGVDRANTLARTNSSSGAGPRYEPCWRSISNRDGDAAATLSNIATTERHGALRPPPQARLRQAARHQVMVPRNEMDGRGRWGPRRGRIWPDCHRSREDDEMDRSSIGWRPAAPLGAPCRPSGRGKHRSRHTFDHVEFVSLHTLQQLRRHAAAFLAAPTSWITSSRSGAIAERRGAAALIQAHHAVVR